MSYPDPAEVAMYAKDGETVLADTHDHVSIRDRYVVCHPTVADLDDVPAGARRNDESIYIPWRRIHAIRRDYTEENDE